MCQVVSVKAIQSLTGDNGFPGLETLAFLHGQDGQAQKSLFTKEHSCWDLQIKVHMLSEQSAGNSTIFLPLSIPADYQWRQKCWLL